MLPVYSIFKMRGNSERRTEEVEDIMLVVVGMFLN